MPNKWGFKVQAVNIAQRVTSVEQIALVQLNLYGIIIVPQLYHLMLDLAMAEGNVH